MSSISKNRNYGIEALRIFSMFLIVLLHIVDSGKIHGFGTQTNHYFSVFFLVIGYCSVNLYALISGYVGYTDEEKPYRFQKFIPLWLQVAFYSVLFTMIGMILDGDLSKRELFNACLPFFKGRYWYFTAYVPLFFLIPFLNKMVRGCSKKECGILSLALVGFFSFVAFFNDLFYLNKGFSFLWLTVLYVLGACIKKCDLVSKIKPYLLWLGVVLSLFATWFGRIFVKGYATMLLNFLSPTLLLASVCILLLFANMKVSDVSAKIVSFFSSSTFSVYLIHCHPVIWNQFIVGKFTPIASKPLLVYLGCIFGIAIAIYLGATLVDKIRMILFFLGNKLVQACKRKKNA